MDKTFEIIQHQASEIERLRFALYGCLVASKRTDPIEYAASLDYVHEQAHEALYGHLIEFNKLERTVITHKYTNFPEC